MFAEELYKYYRHDYQVRTYSLRFHNVYGPFGIYDGGKEKAPAAISRKVAMARDGEEIEIWVDGEQTRAFMYVDDCVEGLIRLISSDHHDALNPATIAWFDQRTRAFDISGSLQKTYQAT